MTEELEPIKFNLAQRILGRCIAAVQGFRDPMHFNPYGNNGGISYGGTFYSAGGPTYGGPGVYGNRMAGTDINYLREVGDPTQSSLVMAAVNWMGRTFGDAPLAVQKEKPDGADETITGHELTNLWRYPNPFYTSSQMSKAMALSWILNGNIYILKQYDLRGRVAELWWLPHWMVRPRWDPADDTSFITYYDYTVGQKNYQLPVERVIHLRNGIDPHYDRCGMAPLLALLRELFSDIELINYTALLARSGMVPPWFVTPKDGTNAVGIKGETLKDKIVRMTTGDRRGQVAYIPMALEVHQLGFDSSKLDLTPLHRISEERMAAVIGIPASTLGFGGIKDDPTYANAAQADRRAYATFSVPMWTSMAMDLTKQLLHADYDDDPTQSIIFDTSKVPALQEDQDLRHTRYREDAIAGLITVYQFQESAGYDHPDENAKYYIMPGRTIPVTSEAALNQAKLGAFSTTDTETGLLEDVDPSLPPAQPQLVDGEPMPKPPKVEPAKSLRNYKKLTTEELEAARAFWQAIPNGKPGLWDAKSNGNEAHG